MKKNTFSKIAIRIFVSYLFFHLFLHFPLLEVSAQGGQWIWMKGDTTFNSGGSFGIQGIPSPTNNPRSIYEACQWTDLNGDFWIFGGGYGGSSVYSDLWKFDVSSNNWTWVNGPGVPDEYASYGIQGVASPSNHPGARGLAAATWVDFNNNLWLFGGYGKAGISSSLSYELNDLWKYNPSSNEWTWMKGDTVINAFGNYGIQGVAAPSNTPGSRHETNCTWVDFQGRLWLFGGFVSDPSFFNAGADDLWMYDPATNEWTWVKGSATVGTAAVYGVKGVPNANNTPGGRCTYSRWKDNVGNFWLFGGWNTISGNMYNDLWKFDITSYNWTWVNGSSLQSDPGVYSSFCNNDTNDFPSARYETRSSWTDHCGNFWLYGGCNQNVISSVLGDMWMFDPLILTWKWIFGNTNLNRPSHYGSLGVANSLNDPGSRLGAVSFVDNSGNLWMFGGDEVYGGGASHNDLWKFVIDPNCVPANCGNALPDVSFYSSDTVWCDKKSIDYFDISTNNPTSWQWYFTGAVPSSSTLQNPPGIYYPSYGSFDVKLVACNAFGCDSIFMPSFINEFQLPSAPVISVNYDTLFSSSAPFYQWYDQSGMIPGATGNYYIFNQPGSYFVIITDSIGCSSPSTPVIIDSDDELNFNYSEIRIFPNPLANKCMLRLGLKNQELVIVSISDIAGSPVSVVFNNIMAKGINSLEMNLMDYAKGIYICEVKTIHHTWRSKLIVQ